VEEKKGEEKVVVVKEKETKKVVKEKVVVEESKEADGQEKVVEEKVEKLPKMHVGRVIVRNIQYDFKELHIRKFFEKYGEVTEVNVPMKTDLLNRGFAFVEFGKKEGA